MTPVVLGLLMLASDSASASSVPRRPLTPKAIPRATGEWPDLAGRWASAQVSTAVSEAPLLGDLTTETLALSLVEIRQKGRELELTQTVCRLETSSPTPFVKTVYPPAFLRALSGSARRGRLERRGDATWLVLPRAWEVKGASLDAVTAPLPESADDPRVVDGDGDGAPGLTVEIAGLVTGLVRVVTRGWTAGAGRVDPSTSPPSEIAGRIRWWTDQRVVAVTHSLLAHRPKTEPHPDPRRSWFRLRRLPPGATCRDVSALGRDWTESPPP